MIRLLGFAAALLLGACASSTLDLKEPRQVRELTDKEKSALHVAMAKAHWLSPEDRRIKWMPVSYVPGTSETDYGGLVSDKQLFGGFGEFRTFHAVIKQSGGEFVEGRIDRTIENHAALQFKAAEILSNSMVNNWCTRAGYVDFSKARS
jgi:hypothetical protein